MPNEGILFQVVLIFLLILANGFFAGSEIAIIATRKTRIDALLEKGVRAAVAVSRLKNEPDRFLATVQIGVTLVGTMASAMGGVVAVEFLEPGIRSLPFPFVEEWATFVSILLVVLPISYFSLVLGELVPKTLALRFSERIACLVARPLDFFSRLTSLPVKVLTLSTNVFLWPFGGWDASHGTFVSQEEIKALIREGAAKGNGWYAVKNLANAIIGD